MNTGPHTLDSTFNREVASILIETMTLHETFLKFGLLSRNFRDILNQLKSYPKLWKLKYMQEFMSRAAREQKRYATPEG